MNVLACHVIDKTCEHVLNAYVSHSTSPTHTPTMNTSPTPSVLPSGTSSNSTDFYILIAASAGSISGLLLLIVILQYLYFRQRVRPSPLSHLPQLDSQISMSPMLPARAAAPTLEDEVLNDPCNLGEPTAIVNNPIGKTVAI